MTEEELQRQVVREFYTILPSPSARDAAEAGEPTPANSGEHVCVLLLADGSTYSGRFDTAGADDPLDEGAARANARREAGKAAA